MKHSYLALSIISALTLTACGGPGSEVPLPQPAQPAQPTADPVLSPPQNEPSTEEELNDPVQSRKLNGPYAWHITSTSDPENKLKKNKFKAVKSILAQKEDVADRHTTAKWDEFTINPPNEDSPNPKPVDVNNSNKSKNTGNTIFNDNPKSTKKGPYLTQAVNFDLTKEGKTTISNIELSDGSTVKIEPVKIEYESQVNNYGNEKGDDGKHYYVVQSVHIFGDLTEHNRDEDLNIAYVYGDVTPFSEKDYGSDKIAERQANNNDQLVTYNGPATYRKNNGGDKIFSGTSHFKTTNFKQISGKISIPDANKDYTFTGLDIIGGSFQSSDYGNPGKFTYDDGNNEQIRGTFYGKDAQNIGGVFYDKEGVGTFLGTETE